jgi:hypothetical protein
MNLISRLGTVMAVALSLTAPMALASDDTVDAATQDKVRAELTAQGYEVRRIQREDGMIEVYAVKDGKTYELYLDETLKVVKTADDD